MAAALESNLVLEDVEVTPKLLLGEFWSKIFCCMDLNWGGRRLLRQEGPLPGGFWPLVLERASRGAEKGMRRTLSAADAIYCLVRDQRYGNGDDGLILPLPPPCPCGTGVVLVTFLPPFRSPIAETFSIS